MQMLLHPHIVSFNCKTLKSNFGFLQNFREMSSNVKKNTISNIFRLSLRMTDMNRFQFDKSAKIWKKMWFRHLIMSPTVHMIKFDTTRFHVLHKHEIQKPYLVSYEKVIVVLIFHE